MGAIDLSQYLWPDAAQGRQPQIPVGIDWSNPITHGLVLASNPISLDVIGPEGRKIGRWVTSSIETSSPVALAVDSSLGVCIESSHDYADLTGTSANVDNSSSITFVSFFRTSTFDQIRSYLTRGADGSGSGWSFRISTNKDKKVEAGIVLTGSGTVGYTATSTTTVDNKAVCAAATYNKDDKYLRLFIDGKQEANVSTNNTVMRSSSIGVRLGGSIGKADPSLGGYSFGRVGVELVWNRALSESEIAAISANPWQIFSPQSIPFFSTAGGATDTPVNPGAGSVTIAGYAPTVTRQASVSLSPGVGSVSITGYSPSITQLAGQSVNPGAGSLSITGYAPAVASTSNVSLVPSSGAFTIAGYSPVVAQTVSSPSVSPTAGTLSLIGYAPTVSRSGTTPDVIQSSSSSKVVLPPSARVPIGTITTTAGTFDVYATNEWARYFDSLNNLTNTTASGTGGLSELNADDTWHDDLEARAALMAVDELRNEIETLRSDNSLLRQRIDELESLIAGS